MEGLRLAEAIEAENLLQCVSTANRLDSAIFESPWGSDSTVASTREVFTLTLTTLRHNLVAFDFPLSTTNDLGQIHSRIISPEELGGRTIRRWWSYILQAILAL
jgi:hypothetical protein